MTLLLLAFLLQEPDKDLRAAFERWQSAKQEFVKGWEEARKKGASPKGGLPEEVQKLRDAADRLRDAFLKEFGTRTEPAALDLLALAHEDARDYKTAADCLEKFVATLKADTDAGRNALYRLSLAALNSKDAARAAKWMRTLIDAEKATPREKRVGDFVRTALYPRQLVELRCFDDLVAFADELDKEAGDVESRRGAVLARFLGSMGLARHDAAEKVLDNVMAKPEATGMNAWAVQCKVAFLAGRRRHDDAARIIDDLLKSEPAKDAPPGDKYARQYLAAVAALLGKPAPEVVVDRWVGADKDPGAKPLETWKGQVVLLDFWQPW
jgi:tetratricopeptide (TPR) repeat protein